MSLLWWRFRLYLSYLCVLYTVDPLFSGLLSYFVSAKAQRMVINSIAKPFLSVRRGKNMQFCWIIDHWCIGWLTVSQSLDSPCAKGSLRDADETLTLIIGSFMSLANCQVYRFLFLFYFLNLALQNGSFWNSPELCQRLWTSYCI